MIRVSIRKYQLMVSILLAVIGMWAIHSPGHTGYYSGGSIGNCAPNLGDNNGCRAPYMIKTFSTSMKIVNTSASNLRYRAPSSDWVYVDGVYDGMKIPRLMKFIPEYDIDGVGVHNGMEIHKLKPSTAYELEFCYDICDGRNIAFSMVVKTEAIEFLTTPTPFPFPTPPPCFTCLRHLHTK